MDRDERYEARKGLWEFELEYVTESEKALCVTQESDPEGSFWLPKSQISFSVNSYEKGDAITVEIPEWLAEENELI